jgi:hypothetical protein
MKSLLGRRRGNKLYYFNCGRKMRRTSFGETLKIEEFCGSEKYW